MEGPPYDPATESFLTPTHQLEALLGRAGTAYGSSGQLAQPPLEGVEAPVVVVQLGEDLECLLPANGVPGAGSEHGDAATELLVAGREVRILTLDGDPLRRLVLDLRTDYQPIP